MLVEVGAEVVGERCFSGSASSVNGDDFGGALLADAVMDFFE